MPTPQVIDLSHHNTVPKYLHDAAAAGVVGVIHKATEGLTHTDAKCAARLALAQDAGMCWGLYHFLRPGNIQKQADFFLSKTDLYDENTLLALDFEVDGISADDLLTWLERVESKTGQKPVLYSGSFLKALKGQERLGGHRLWLAQYGSKAVLPKGFNDYFLWQYSEKGKVPGITGMCDVNTSKMTNRELRQNWTELASLSAKQDSPSDTNIVQQTPADEGTPIDQGAVNLKAEITPEGGVKVESSQPNNAPKERIAVVKAAPQKWYQAAWTKIVTFITGNAVFQWIWGQLDTFQSLHIPVAVWYIVSGGAVVGGLFWIGSDILETRRANERQKEIDQLLVTQNSTVDNLVQLIPHDEVDLYRARGFKIITRGDSDSPQPMVVNT